MKNKQVVEHNLAVAKITGWDHNWTKKDLIRYWIENYSSSRTIAQFKEQVGQLPKQTTPGASASSSGR